MMDIRFGDPRLEVHAGQPLRELNEEEFKKWPVGRLQAALNQVEKELGSNRHAQQISKKGSLGRRSCQRWKSRSWWIACCELLREAY